MTTSLNMNANGREIRRQARPVLGALVFACTILVSVSARAVQPPEDLDVKVENQVVTLEAGNVDVRRVLERLADAADIRIWISDRVETEAIDISVENLPLELALKRLLQDLSYAIVYDEDNDSITSLYVLPPGAEGPARIEHRNLARDDPRRALNEALLSNEIPDDVKAAMLSQNYLQTKDRLQFIESQRLDILTRLIENIERNATANPESIQMLLDALKRERDRE